MQSQCPQCYSSEVVIAKPRSIFIWIAPILLVDAAILVVIFSGAVKNPVTLVIALVVADLLLTIPLIRAFLSRSQGQGGATYHCTACGHTWTEQGESAPTEYGAVETSAAPASSADFQMTVEDVFSIKGRGTVVTGQIEAGSVAKGATVAIHGANGVRETVVDALEMFRKVKTQASAGDNVGLLLRGINKGEVRRRDVLRGIR